jgi:hypothetical protein
VVSLSAALIARWAKVRTDAAALPDLPTLTIGVRYDVRSRVVGAVDGFAVWARWAASCTTLMATVLLFY